MMQARFINQTTVRILYLRYKLFIVPVGVIIGCIAIFIFVIIPQIQSYLSLQGDIQTTQNNIATLKNNLSVLTSMDTNLLDQRAQLVSRALPPTKDFAGILNSLSDAAIAANISLGDYSLPVGDLSGNAPGAQNTLQMTLDIVGSVNNIDQFIVRLKNQLPLVDIQNITISGGGSGVIVLLFYYQPIPNVSLPATTLLPQLSKQDEDLLNTLSKMDSGSIPTVPIATTSATSQ